MQDNLGDDSVNTNLQFQNQNLSKRLDKSSSERDELQIRLLELQASIKDREDSNLLERFKLETEIKLSRARVSNILESVRSEKRILRRISDRIGDHQLEGDSKESFDFGDELEIILSETESIKNVSLDLERKILEYEETRRKEKKQFENSIVSLTEENRDINSLLRIALMEKEMVEKRSKGTGEQRKMAILQIAERGLQRVGFRFFVGGAAEGSSSDQTSNLNASVKSDGGECEGEVTSLASTVEKMMKNLRIEISDLKHSLEESRSDSERLQTFVDQQAEKIKDSTLYIKELEERENMLALSVEELTMEIKEAREEVTRWREACELEVEAGKCVIEEREKEIAMLRKELEIIKSSLDIANSKVMLKERLAVTAMAAQAAAEASLQLADRRSLVLRERIEELMKQLEEEADRSKGEKYGSMRKLRHVRWPWQAVKLTPTVWAGGGSAIASWLGIRNRRTMPDMESLLHFV